MADGVARSNSVDEETQEFLQNPSTTATTLPGAPHVDEQSNSTS